MNKIRELRVKKGVTQTELGSLLGVTKNSISYYENGKRQPSPDMLVKLADYFGVSIDALLGRDDDAPEEAPERTLTPDALPVYEEEYYIPVVASLHCGFGYAGDGFTTIDEKPAPISFKERYGEDTVLLYATGNSMYPTILDGDLLLVCPGSEWDDGLIVVIHANDEDTIKRIYHAKDGGIDLLPDNRKLSPKHFSPEDIRDGDIAVLGHVLMIWPRDVKPRPRWDQ